jgi:DNA-directed RNA polymerase specialized sigma24 family protein
MQITPEIITWVEQAGPDADLRQEVYVKVLEAADEQEVTAAWIGLVYHHLMLDEKRREKRQSDLRQDNAEQIRQNFGWEGQAADPLEEYMAQHDMQVKLKDLSDMQRRTLNYLVIEGLAPEKIALAEKTTANVIYKRLYDIKKLLGV